MAHKSFSVLIRPNTVQQRMIRQNIGCGRFIYNKTLEERIRVYETLKDDRDALHSYKYKTEKEYKMLYPWLALADSQALQQSRRDQDKAFKNFFNGKAKFPKFHKKGAKNSYRTRCINNNVQIDFKNKRIRLPKIGWVKYIDNRVLEDFRILSATVKVTPSGNFHCSINYEYEKPEPKPVNLTNPKITGLDMSYGKLYVDSDGNSPDYVRNYRGNEKRIARLSSKISKQKNGSKGKAETKLKLARVHEHVKNGRKDLAEKESTKLIKENDVLVIESLQLQNMLCQKSVNDLGWGFFVSRLITKAEDAGKMVIEADKWFASTKTCHVCGEKNISIALSDREWDCPHCRTHHNRDYNAAVNLKMYGMKAVENLKVSRATSTNGKDKARLPADFQRDQCLIPLWNQENVSIPPVFSRRAC